MKKILLVAMFLAIQGCTDAPGHNAHSVSPTVNDGEESNFPATDENDEGGEERPGNGTALSTNPRWVLYDRDGNAVNGIVSPVRYESIPRNLGDTWDPWDATIDCVLVSHLGQDWPAVNAIYSLRTGKIEDCTRDDLTHYVTFSGPDCLERPLTPHVAAQILLDVDGIIHWPRGQVVRPESVWWFNGEGECVERPVGGAELLLPLEPLPEDLRNALPNPPYTLKAEF